MQDHSNPTQIKGLPKSKSIHGLEWIGEHIPYHEPNIRGDTYPITWSDDDELYTSAGDPLWGDIDYIYSDMVEDSRPSQNEPTTTGLDVEKFIGIPPNHRILKVNDMVNYNGFGGGGPKPSGMISVKGVLYLAVQNLMGYKSPVYGKSQHGSDALIIQSVDKGKTWSKGWMAEWEIRRLGPMFPGSKFGGPSFIQFGKDNVNAIDEYIYAVSTDQWDNGTELRLGRVKNTDILDAEAWEFVSGFEDGHSPQWTNLLEQSIPILSIDRSIGMPEIVYLPHLDKYLLLTWKLNQDFSNNCGSQLIVLESSLPWGPFHVVHFQEDWECAALSPYCPRMPLKWFDSSSNEGWIVFSGSWVERMPYYRMHVRRFRLQI